jgi:Terminase large subunit, T4likevirus-type, N-terminal
MRSDPANLIRYQIAPSTFATEELGLTLRPYQRLFLDCSSKTLAALWSRQTGKSFCAAALVASYMACGPGRVALVISPAQRQSQLLGATVRKMLLSAKIKLDIDSQQVLSLAPKQVGENSVVMLSPSGNDGSSIRGPSVKLLIFEEASFINEAVLQAALPMVSSNADARIIYISSAGIWGSWFTRLWADPTMVMARLRVTADESGAFSGDMLDRLRATLGPKRFAQEMECVFGSESGTSVFSEEVLNSLFSPRSMGEETSAGVANYPIGNIRKPDFGRMFASKSAFAGR